MITEKQDVMISIRPRWCGEILAGAKEIEVRKGRPKQETPFKCYIYETQGKTEIPWMDEDGHMIFKGRGAVVAEFICDRIYQYSTSPALKDECDISDEDMVRMSGLTKNELSEYEYSATPRDFTLYNIGLYGWHISLLREYKKPYPLSDFCTGSSTFRFNEEGRTVYSGMKRAPQSWCYVDDADPLRGDRE